MRLTEEQFNYLKVLGHELVPAIDIGAGGLTNSVIKQIDRALSEQELVKVRVPYGNRARRDELLRRLAPLSDSLLIQRAGNAALLYRPAARPVIKLPGSTYGS
jgi:RNA-binding protein